MKKGLILIFITMFSITLVNAKTTNSKKTAIMLVSEGYGILSSCAITIYFGENLKKEVSTKCKSLRDNEIAQLNFMLSQKVGQLIR